DQAQATIRSAPGRAAVLRRLSGIAPAQHMAGAGCRALRVSDAAAGKTVGIEILTAFEGITGHVIKAPLIGEFLADGWRCAAIGCEPGVVPETGIADVVAVEKSAVGCSRAAGILPLRLGGQAIMSAPRNQTGRQILLGAQSAVVRIGAER